MAPPRDPTNVMGRRVAAFIIDWLIVAAIAVVVLAATKDHTFTGAPSGACQQLRDAGISRSCLQLGSTVYTWKRGGILIGVFAGLLAMFVDNVILPTLTGASLGKMILGLRVVDADGRIAGFGRQFVRWLLLVVDSFCFYIVGIATSFATHPHKRVGDMVAGTFVVGHTDVGQPVTGAPPAYSGGYQAPGGWTPPGATPEQQPWGAPPPPPAAWGAPQPQEGWGAQPGWGAPQSQPQAGGAPPPPLPTRVPTSWGTPPPEATPTPPPPEPPAPEPPPPEPPDTPPPPPQTAPPDRAATGAAAAASGVVVGQRAQRRRRPAAVIVRSRR